MKYLFLIFALTVTAGVRAVMIDPITPKSYTVSFVGEGGLPANAKIVGVALEVDQAEAVRVRSMPPGWLATVFTPDRARFGVGIDLFSWGKDQGTPATLADLNERFWIVAVVDQNDKPVPPRIIVRVAFFLPAKPEEQTIQLSASAFRLTYLP